MQTASRRSPRRSASPNTSPPSAKAQCSVAAHMSCGSGSGVLWVLGGTLGVLMSTAMHLLVLEDGLDLLGVSAPERM